MAAQVEILEETGFPPEATFCVPNSRPLAPLLATLGGNWPEPFHRPTHNGRVVGVDRDAEHLRVNLVSTFDVFRTILEGDGWSCGRSESGRFTTRIIELLGGANSTAGNQPAIRWVLDEAARSPHGHPISRLIETARRNQGTWAARSFDSNYPKNAVYYLLSKKLLRPLLPIRCPACATTSHLPPEELATEVKCAMCERTSPLGWILGLSGKNADWHYRPASALTASRLAETMPIMASLNVLRSLLSGFTGSTGAQLGLTISEGKSWACEIDVALFASERGAPLVIIGEVKSYRDSITTTDLKNLAKVQQHLRSRGIECLVLVATLRKKFEADELEALRSFAENSPPDSVFNFGQVRPVLPIALTSESLSTPPFSEGHPTHWDRPTLEVLGLAEASCKRNLGLSRVEIDWTPQEIGWTFSWGADV
ncbi:hypothetical protein ABZZ44_00260 [Streptomyces sp. NPDC006460]|uniref:hypothetical protein n=1 Tax=Streptomyces sp. NPDC006460 TaxID=3154304 RepID=UPI0033A22D59